MPHGRTVAAAAAVEDVALAPRPPEDASPYDYDGALHALFHDGIVCYANVRSCAGETVPKEVLVARYRRKRAEEEALRVHPRLSPTPPDLPARYEVPPPRRPLIQQQYEEWAGAAKPPPEWACGRGFARAAVVVQAFARAAVDAVRTYDWREEARGRARAMHLAVQQRVCQVYANSPAALAAAVRIQAQVRRLIAVNRCVALRRVQAAAVRAGVEAFAVRKLQAWWRGARVRLPHATARRESARGRYLAIRLRRAIAQSRAAVIQRFYRARYSKRTAAASAIAHFYVAMRSRKRERRRASYDTCLRLVSAAPPRPRAERMFAPAVRVIACAWRCFCARRVVAARRRQRRLSIEREFAVVIQRWFRAFSETRKRRSARRAAQDAHVLHVSATVIQQAWRRRCAVAEVRRRRRRRDAALVLQRASRCARARRELHQRQYALNALFELALDGV
eukprot:TRINITY_DN1490_c0_g2_i1.p1 TRINITY_DN1490_c0_g2~~TRINITY_DN1490_c0_g2_i1.p1  ORF type:complete len:450 (+),score=102.65 TRINITY_DN1490_c0_g2_i1:53-1402(+)